MTDTLPLNTLSSPADLETTRESVRDYYGNRLETRHDLQTNACCTVDSTPEHLRPLVANVDKEILDKFYGCGSPIPQALTGKTVLDLGCGTGRDVYVVSQLVGESGRVIGIDMTDAQLDVARRHQEGSAKRFGHAKSNVSFLKGHIEDLAAAGIEDESIDVVLSNCVINLSADKPAVFSEIFRVLKPGGELYFSDVFADRRIPAELRSDPVLLGECLSGAMYIEDFRRLLASLGCPDYRVMTSHTFDINDMAAAAKIGMVRLSSKTIRAFKLASLEDACEDFGQSATYKGTLPDSPHRFVLDEHHVFEANRPERVCGNSAAMIQETRFAEHFEVAGDRSRHFGLFPCFHPAKPNVADPAAGSCC